MYVNCPVSYKGITNVQHNFNVYFDLLTNKVCNLFKWEGLPETIDERALNLSLMLRGKVCFTKFNDKLYALDGNVGGEPNVYYEPQFFIIANPVLGSKQVRIRRKDGSSSTEGLEGILMGNSDVDVMSDRTGPAGLFGLIYQTAGLLADNISSLNVSQINGRVSQIWTADTDVMARSAEVILRDIYDGKPYKIVQQDIIDKVGVLPAATTGQTNTLLNLIEAHQYILAQFYNEIGIGANYNMKRERVNTAETDLMTGSLDINIENMMENRKRAVEQINDLFGTSISVELNLDVFNDDINAGLAEEELGEDVQEDKVPEPEETPKEEEVKEEEVKEEIKKEEDDKNGGDE